MTPNILSDKVEKLMERDYFLDAEQALEMGLVDKVLTSREEQERVMAAFKGETDGKKSDDDKNGGEGSDGGGDGPPPNPSARHSPS
jgi:enoyl-CoA hydratase/carnithine racemase